MEWRKNSRKRNTTSRLLTLTAIFLTLCLASSGHPAFLQGAEKTVKNPIQRITLANSPISIILDGSASYRVSLDGKNLSDPLPQRHQIRLRGLSFDPLTHPPQSSLSVPAGRLTGDRSGLWIIQFHTQALEEYQKRIRAAGAELGDAIPDHAMLAVMSETTAQKVRQMNFVRWVGPYLPEFKLGEGLGKDIASPSAAAPKRYSLWLSKNKTEIVARFIEAIGGQVLLKGKGRRMEILIDNPLLQQILAHAHILAVENGTNKENDMDLARSISGANYLETVEGYTGQGVRAEVMDGGIRATHQDFQANPPIFNPSNSTDTSHGTSCYGIVFGSGAGNATARGLLPNAQQPIMCAYGSVTDRYAHTQTLVNSSGNYRAVFQSNSWGDTRTQQYTSISAEMDEIIFDLDILILQSQSNAGTKDSRPQAWAKNILSVGGFNHYNTLDKADDCWCSTASIGPATDGRIKPDLSHFYDYTYAPYYTSDSAYSNFGGTSGATPITAGYAGLMFQMWADGVFSGGPGQNRDVFNSRPHASTAKALLIHSAWQYAFSGATHDLTRVHQGWGMADVKNLYDSAQAHNWGFTVLIDESAVIAPLAVHTYSVTVDGTKPLKATMVYADLPGVPGAAVHRINDLTLKVTSPSGTIYWGNNGLNTGVWSTSGGSANTVDTVENVFIQSPAAGTWVVSVIASEVVQDSHTETPALDADYALIVSGGSTGPNDPPAAPSGLTATAAEAAVNLDWADNSESDLANYRVKRSTTAGGPYSQIAVATVSNYKDSSVTAGTRYYYIVTAVDSANNESGNSGEASAIPFNNPPAAPQGLTATGGNAIVTLDWADNAETDLANYKVKRATVSGGPYTVIASPTASGYTDTTVTNGTTYYYVVSAVDSAANESANSSQVSATPQAPVEIILEQNTTGGAAQGVRNGTTGSQSFKHGTSGTYRVNKIVLHLSRASNTTSALSFNIGTARNSGAVTGSTKSISASSVTNTSGGTSFMTYTITYTTPVTLNAGQTYYLNFSTSGSRYYYLDLSSSSVYANGTYYRNSTNQNKDCWFQVVGTE